MTKPPSLSAAMKRATRGEPGPAASAPTPPADAPGPGRSQSLPPSRQGKKAITGHFDPAVSRLLRTVALEEETSVQELLREAINDLLAKRGRPPVA